MNITQKTADNITILELSGRLDTRTSPDLETRVLEILDAGHRRLLMDFSDLDYINSTGLRILVMAFQRLSQEGGQLAVCGVKDYIFEIFDISGYNKLFPLYANQSDALTPSWEVQAG
jgi:anti-sigma B factor antagonist